MRDGGRRRFGWVRRGEVRGMGEGEEGFWSWFVGGERGEGAGMVGRMAGGLELWWRRAPMCVCRG